MASSTIEPIDDTLEHSIEVLLGYSADHKSCQLLMDWADCQGISFLDDFHFFYNKEDFEHTSSMEYMSSPQLHLETCEMEQLLRLLNYMHYVVLSNNIV